MLEVYLPRLHQMGLHPLTLRTRPRHARRPPCAHPARMRPQVACRGQPCASSVSTVVTTVADVRSPQNAVPVVGLKVPRHVLHR